jgi:hypothetical protein
MRHRRPCPLVCLLLTRIEADAGFGGRSKAGRHADTDWSSPDEDVGRSTKKGSTTTDRQSTGEGTRGRGFGGPEVERFKSWKAGKPELLLFRARFADDIATGIDGGGPWAVGWEEKVGSQGSGGQVQGRLMDRERWTVRVVFDGQ